MRVDHISIDHKGATVEISDRDGSAYKFRLHWIFTQNFETDEFWVAKMAFPKGRYRILICDRVADNCNKSHGVSLRNFRFERWFSEMVHQVVGRLMCERGEVIAE